MLVSGSVFFFPSKKRNMFHWLCWASKMFSKYVLPVPTILIKAKNELFIVDRSDTYRYLTLMVHCIDCAHVP